MTTASRSSRTASRRSSAARPEVIRSSGSRASTHSRVAAAAISLRTHSTRGTGSRTITRAPCRRASSAEPSALPRSITITSSAQATDARHSPSRSASLRQAMQTEMPGASAGTQPPFGEARQPVEPRVAVGAQLLAQQAADLAVGDPPLVQVAFEPDQKDAADGIAQPVPLESLLAARHLATGLRVLAVEVPAPGLDP